MKIGDQARLERCDAEGRLMVAVEGTLIYYAEADVHGCGGAEFKNPSPPGYEGFWALGEDRVNGTVTTLGRPLPPVLSEDVTQ